MRSSDTDRRSDYVMGYLLISRSECELANSHPALSGESETRSIDSRHMDIQIRRIRADEWRELRSHRLRALGEAPTAFGSTLAQEQAFPDDVWRERALGASFGCDRATFVAEINGTWIGAVTGLANQFTTANGVPLLAAMFVVASWRRRGVGVRLVDTVACWAQECGASQIALWVTSNNASAVALYKQCDFSFSGAAKSHSHATGLVETEMARQLQEAGSCQ